MITDVKKYLFIGVKEDLQVFFKRSQEKGMIEFLRPEEQRAVDYPDIVQNLISALKILGKEPVVKQAKLTKDLDFQKLAQTVVESKSCLEKLLEEERMLRAEIARIEPLGDFSLQDIRTLETDSNRHVQFFCMKRSKLPSEVLDNNLVFLNSQYDMDYFMSISGKLESFSGMIEMHFEKSLSQLQKEWECAKTSIHNWEKDLKENAAYMDFLREHLIQELNRYYLASATDQVGSHMNDTLFTVEGWIPQNRMHVLFPLLEGLGIHAEEIAIEEGERVPTYMENTSYGKIGEDLVHIYDAPATNDKDPSTWVFWGFAVFFAMIISDAGYGLIFLALALFLRRKFSEGSPSAKRFVRLFIVLSSSCIAWGILAGSYFGVDLSPKNPLNQVSIIHYLSVKKADYHIAHQDEIYREILESFPQVAGITNGQDLLQEASKLKNGFLHYVVLSEFRDSIFMEIALLVGAIHISLSLLRHFSRNFAGLGWILAIVGGYLFFPKVLNATSVIHFMHLIPKQIGYELGIQLLWGGMGLAIFLAVVQHKWRGFIELTKPIELFADVLSYLRLYALGLAAMILASTFNEMGMGIGFVGGFFVILLGHIINIVVGIMGGTIHGLRLNFIEWYHHSFEGGGKLFNPLKLLKIRGE